MIKWILIFTHAINEDSFLVGNPSNFLHHLILWARLNYTHDYSLVYMVSNKGDPKLI